uniref:Uncharacterized protein n=1 Tax=viral metagenome TaxID=1070528 RepID=A0A6M3L1Z8_9ZZZZ
MSDEGRQAAATACATYLRADGVVMVDDVEQKIHQWWHGRKHEQVAAIGPDIVTLITDIRALAKGGEWVCQGTEDPRCFDCGLLMSDDGWADLVVSHEMWLRLSPTGDEGGLLCPTCMVRAAKRKGVECQAVFRSGPFDYRGEIDDENA